ncbi:MAG: hypothetical protein MN733_07315, partial [Nitrososphaera sp.]|nr:hypothetical protein [Nitrososphaera sp.]
SNLTIGNLLALTSDGIVAIQDGRSKKEIVHQPIGFLTGMTREMFQRWGRRWYETGFSRRFIPLHFNYSTPTLRRAQEKIMNDTITRRPLKPRPITIGKPRTPAIPDILALRLYALSERYAAMLGKLPYRLKVGTKPAVVQYNILPLDPHLCLKAMARGHALLENRAEVNQNDVSFIERFVDLANYVVPVHL